MAVNYDQSLKQGPYLRPQKQHTAIAGNTVDPASKNVFR